MKKPPIMPPQKGAKKPIILSEFHDRFQVDLIDMRTQREVDIFGTVLCWIVTNKDHLTGLIYLCALPCKKVEYMAQ